MSERKRILLVSSAFYPEISPRSFRATELAKEFCRQGHEVNVISKFRDYDYSGFLKTFSINFKMWSKPVLPKLTEFKQRPISLIARKTSRLLSLLFEYPGIEEMYRVKKMLRHEGGYDLMVSFAVPFPVHWGVARARTEKKRIAEIWVADCGDPYMFARLDTFRKPFYFKYLEVNFCRKCDFISVPFEAMKIQFYSQFMPKLRVIPQGFNFEEVRVFEGQINNDVPLFIFAGSIIPGKRDLALLFDFLASLTLDFLFIVYTNQKDWFEKYKLILGEKLQINGYIERLSLLYEMSKADFLINIDTVLDNHSNTEAVPSKLIDYALSNRPILNIHSSSLDKEMVLEFLNKNYSRRRVINKSDHDINRVSGKFLELLA